jgi:hypothetical protein
MNCRNRIALLLCPVTLLAGCASTNVTEQTPMVSPGLARPNQIWVYDFVADPTKVPPILPSAPLLVRRPYRQLPRSLKPPVNLRGHCQSDSVTVAG